MRADAPRAGHAVVASICLAYPPQREGDISISTGETGYLRSPTIPGRHSRLANDLWAVCAEGGCAWRLTAGEGDARGPRLSPDGSRTS
jgi:hypothetical protein